MKKILFLIIGLSLVLTGCGNDNKNSSGDYNTQRLAITNNGNNSNNENTEPVEEPLASFSTKVSQKDPDRQTNITIACNSLNGIVVKAGETFSFCNTLGPAKPEDGYEKADTFDGDGDTIQAYRWW